MSAGPLPLPRKDVPGIVWPPVEAGANALRALLGQLEETQWLAPDMIEKMQRRQLAVLARYLRDHSPFFARRLKEAGLAPEALALSGGLGSLPPLRRGELQREEGMFCARVPDRHHPVGETRTSGSTGEPVAVRRTRVSQLFWSAMTVRDHLWHKRDLTGSMALVRAKMPGLTRRDDWGAPMNLLFRTGPALGIPISLDASELYRVLADFQPSTLLIYPSTLAALVQHMEATAGKLDSLRFLRTIGETLSPATRQAARTVLGVNHADVYSSQELGYIALQCPVSGLYHVMAETMIVEVVDENGAPCGPGEVGRVLITDLHNFGTPLVRYEIGDYAEVGETCSCGRGLPTLARILGRERNLIRMPDGTRHWPLVGYDRFREIAGVRQYQFIQVDREVVDVRLVTDSPLSEAQEAGLRDHIAAALGHPFELRFHYYEERLPLSASGKFEEFLCLVRD